MEYTIDTLENQRNLEKGEFINEFNTQIDKSNNTYMWKKPKREKKKFNLRNEDDNYFYIELEFNNIEYNKAVSSIKLFLVKLLD